MLIPRGFPFRSAPRRVPQELDLYLCLCVPQKLDLYLCWVTKGRKLKKQHFNKSSSLPAFVVGDTGD